MNAKKQIVMFSATYSDAALKNSQRILGKDYYQLAIKNEDLTLKGVFQYYMQIDSDNKMETIADLYNHMNIN